VKDFNTAASTYQQGYQQLFNSKKAFDVDKFKILQDTSRQYQVWQE
jgi:hypothetical protein